MRLLPSIVAALLLSVSNWSGPGPADPLAQTTQIPGAEPKRIISLIPPVTEMLFAMGAGPQVVAVSSFDNYPPQVARLQRVGALLDPDVERILSLRPDLVVIYESQTDLRKQLERARIPTYIYRHAGLADVTTTMSDVGARVGHGAAAAQLAREIERTISAVRQRVAALPRIPTLVVFEREARTLRGIYASGGVGFIHDMVEAAGGANIFADVKREAVQATTELILARRPDIIIELRSSVLTDADRRRELATWRTLGALPAVRSGRLFLFADQRMSIAGPRVGEVVEVLGRTIHPEAFRR
jgi:ABC-type Fe3+-hydroxamate transport system substrate-binding protein